MFPEPVGHYVSVKMPKMEVKTAGGIYLPDQTREMSERAAVSGELLGVGPACKFLTADDVGKTVFFGRYAGSINGDDEYRLIDEDQIRAKQ